MIKLTEDIIVKAVLYLKLNKLKAEFPGVEFIQNEILRTTNTVMITGAKGYYSEDIIFTDELTVISIPDWDEPSIISENYKLKIEYNICNSFN